MSDDETLEVSAMWSHESANEISLSVRESVVVPMTGTTPQDQGDMTGERWEKGPAWEYEEDVGKTDPEYWVIERTVAVEGKLESVADVWHEADADRIIADHERVQALEQQLREAAELASWWRNRRAEAVVEYLETVSGSSGARYTANEIRGWLATYDLLANDRALTASPTQTTGDLGMFCAFCNEGGHSTSWHAKPAQPTEVSQ